MGATAIALSSQDILHHIFTLGILSQADVLACTLVCSEWAAVALTLLWRHPHCPSFRSLKLLLGTLRHEIDLSGPIASTIQPETSAGSIADAVMDTTIALRRSLTTCRKSPIPRSSTLVATPHRPQDRRKEYGIPFHGQRVYHRAQFIRRIDFGTLASVLSMDELEVLARSSKLGFRSLDLRNVRQPFSNHLLSILINSRSLKELSLGYAHIPIDAVILLESCLNGLIELRLMNCPESMGDTELSMILKHCPKLKILQVEGDSFTDDSLNAISKICLDLETLVIRAPKMTDQVVEQIAVACTRLRSWRLENCANLLDATIDSLERRYHNSDNRMSPLYGHSVMNSSNNNTCSLLQDTARLGSTLADSAISGIPTPDSSTFMNYHDLDHIVSHRFSSTLEYSTTATGRLTTIELRNCTGIRPQLISNFLRSQLGLEHLVLGGNSITDEALDSLIETPLVRLQSLELIDCGEISDETMVPVMYNCDLITKLVIFGSCFTLRTFSAISQYLPRLEELHLERVPLIMNESLQDILTKCSRLRILKLWHCRNLTQDLFTDDQTQCETLEELEYMDNFQRQYKINDSMQVRFLTSIVTRFEKLKILRLAKLGDSSTSLNLVSYLCQLDQLEKFTLLQNPGLDCANLKELKQKLPMLTHIGVGISDQTSEGELLKFATTNLRPGVQMYKRMLESSSELDQFVC
ncbi:hypothetical protein B0O80DRAFT_466817 [Mortierella sp. GBAus27b]|nr:hypothetical protein B0O80DRAFT_466817 [Mortierella sp. GBAus27b]